MIITVLRAILLILSFFGYCFYWNRKGLDAAFCPAVTVAGIGCAMFFAGILNIMRLTVVCLIVGGLLCGWLARPLKVLRQEKGQPRSYRGLWLFGLFSLILGLFVLRLHGTVLTTNDNFTHWLTVVREMLLNDRMPNFLSPTVTFQGYPTGTAGFIYFICKTLGIRTDGMVLIAQSVIAASCILTPFGFVKKFRPVPVLIAFGLGIYFLIANTLPDPLFDTPIADLLVDYLISMLAAASLFVMMSFRQNPKLAFLWSLPLQIFLVTVKNSGLMFTAVNAIFLAVLALQTAEKKRFRVFGGFFLRGILPGAATFFLWSRHVKLVFASGEMSTHSMSLRHYAAVLTDRSGAEILEIIQIFLHRFCSPSAAWMVMGILSGILVLCMIFCPESRKRSGGVLAAIWGCYVGFMIFLLGMYLVSMSYVEAVVLASYDRYERQMLIFLVAAVAVWLLAEVIPAEAGRGRKWLAVVTAALFLILPCSEAKHIPKLVIPTDLYTGSMRQQLEQIRDRYGLPEGDSYFIYSDTVENDYYYTYWLSTYVFGSLHTHTAYRGNLEQRRAEIANYRWVIVFDHDEEIDQLLNEIGYEGDGVVYLLPDAAE